MSFKIQIVPTYKEVFKEITPSIEELLKGIPTKTIIVLFSIIMSELEKNGDENEIQEKIWNALSFRFPQKIKNQIKSLGFKYVETENFNGKTFMDYENGKFKLTIVLYQAENDLGEMISNYEISITYHT